MGRGRNRLENIRHPIGKGRAGVLTNLTPNTTPSGRTDAGEATDTILTGSTTETGLRRALVHVDPTVRPGETLGTETPEPTGTGLTGTTVVARLSLALIDLLITERTTVTGGTAAVRHPIER